jgi:hypothetical protein
VMRGKEDARRIIQEKEAEWKSKGLM